MSLTDVKGSVFWLPGVVALPGEPILVRPLGCLSSLFSNSVSIFGTWIQSSSVSEYIFSVVVKFFRINSEMLMHLVKKDFRYNKDLNFAFFYLFIF